jgi:hypothetical protein
MFHSNKLFCTFTDINEVENLVRVINSSYDVLNKRIFTLKLIESDIYVCTYNLDSNNVNEFPQNTILVHRQKHSNTLYSINGLNTLIKHLNNGILNKDYIINWINYTNSIILSQENQLKVYKTQLYKIHKFF